MSEHPPDRFWSGIDIVKLVAGTLAAISAAVVGSFIGVAGTLVGAAVVSLVSGLGTEVYAKSLERGVSRIKGRSGQSPVTTPDTGGSPAAAQSSTEDRTRGGSSSAPQAGVAKARRSRWQTVALPAMAFFVLAMGAVFAVESIAGKSVSSMVGATSSRTTTLGSAVGAGKKAVPTPETTEAPDGEQSGEPVPGATTPAQEGSTTAPGQPGTGDAGEQGNTGGQDSTGSGGSGGQEDPTGERASSKQSPDGQAPAGAPAPQ